MGFHDRGLQYDETEIFVDADIHLDQAFHDRLVFADPCRDEFHEIIVPTRDEMAFDNGINLFDCCEEAREINLPVIFEGDLGEDGQSLTELGNVDLGGIAGNEALRLEPLDSASGTGSGIGL